MSTRPTENRLFWLITGTVFGMALSYYCPHEPAYAESAVQGEKFAMCTVDTLTGSSEAVFILDFVTGRLLGAAHNTNPQQSPTVFTQTYARNLAADFGVVDNAQYVMVPGRAIFRATGGPPPATGAIYVGELTSGIVNMYGFNYIQSNRQVPVQTLTLVGSFPWRQSSR